MDILVQDSVMQLKAMTKSRISRERLFAQLRYHQIKHLVEVKRLYMEANGSFCIIPETNTAWPWVIPDRDPDMLHRLSVSETLYVIIAVIIKKLVTMFAYIATLFIMQKLYASSHKA